MPSLRQPPVAQAETPEMRYRVAAARLKALSEDLTAKRDLLERMRMAHQLAGVQRVDERSEHLVARIGPELLERARRRKAKFADEIENLADEIAAAEPGFAAARDEHQMSAGILTGELAIELQPRHAAAVKAIAAALEALSRALQAEEDVRAELAMAAPMPASPYLPDCASLLHAARLSDPRSAAAAWAERVRQLGVLQ